MRGIVAFTSVFGCGLALLMALRQFLKERTPFGRSAVAMYISLSWFQFYESLGGRIPMGGKVCDLPLLTAIVLAGVASHLYFARLYDADGPPRKASGLLYLLLVPSLVVDGAAVLRSAEADALPAIAPGTTGAHWIGGAFLLAMTAAGLFRLFRFFTVRTLDTPGKIVFSLSLYVILSVTLGLLGTAFENKVAADVSSLMLTILLIIVFLATDRHPELMSRFKEELTAAKYRKTTLSGVNLRNLDIRLVHLMAVDEFFAEENCSLATVASCLGVTPHQLSEYVNRHLRKSFPSFLNQYRIAKAKELLENDESKSVLDIAFRVGFGNKTSFNEAFKEQTGTTPMKYRQKSSG